jgi:primary-amine oxidase
MVRIALRRVPGLLALALLSSSANAQTHPLDALTHAEIETAAAVVTADARAAESRFQLITLAEPAKSFVLAWQPGSPLNRRASITAVKDAKTLEIEVDLQTRAIVAFAVRTGVEVPLTITESSEAIDAARSDPSLLAALKKRGFTDPEKVDCAPFAAGYFGIKAHAGKRLLKVGCFDVSRSTNNIFGWPIENLYALVDLRTMQVVQVIDTGNVPVTTQDMNFTEAAIGKLRSPEKPTLITQPNGANYTVTGSQIAWGNWRFHVRFESRQGTVISLARWVDQGKERSVLYQGYMSEMFVPYMDRDYGWYSRTYFDMGEYGVGHLASPLQPGIDCPLGATLLNAVLNDDDGDPDERPNVVCIFERNTGDPAWRHYEVNNKTFEGRPGVELVVRMASQIGNYDYVIDWVFNHAAEIEARVGSTGIVALKGVRSQSMRSATAAADTRFGTLVAPGLSAIQHDHYFNYRLDLDVDGPTNSLQKDVYRRIALPPTSPRRTLYQVKPQISANEGMVDQATHGKHGSGANEPFKLKVISEARNNSLGNPTGYEIAHANHARLMLDPDDWPAKRAAFLRSDLWVTQMHPKERFAAGDYVFASKTIQGLPQWIRQKRSVRNKDIVVWVNFGMHHLVRAEDVPVMPTLWHSFKLRPFNFFDRNPAVDLRTDFEPSSAR